MDYEQKYKAALERAKDYYDIDEDNTMQVHARGIMEYLFPELKESDDERIRKTLIKYINDWKNAHPTWNSDKEFCNKAVEWLEKQKPAECSIDFSNIEQAKKDANNAALDKIEYTSDEPTFDDGWDAAIKYVRQQIKPVEWSEEDEHRRKDAIYFLQSAKKHYASDEEIEATINWLKSLRHQSRWKPSDFQMSCLQKAINQPDTELGCEIENCLQELFNDLKKLKEET